MKQQHWQDYVVGIIGLYVFLTPWIIPYFFPATEMAGSVEYTHIGLGFLLMVTASASLLDGKTWEEMLNLFIGICMVASPWIAQFSGSTLTWNIAACGVAVVLLSGTALLGDEYPMRPI